VSSTSPFTSYLAPIVAFAIFGAAEEWLPPSWYPIAYCVKLAAVVTALLIWRAALQDIQFSRRVILPSIALGLVVLVAWIGIEEMFPYPHLGDRLGFDPHTIESANARVAFVAVRLFGLVLVVPVMEELLWRSFLLRYLSNSDFTQVPIGVFTPYAFAGMVAASALAHPEWLVAVTASGAYGWWVGRTKSIFAAIVAHATTNAGLGCYILVAHDWKYW